MCYSTVHTCEWAFMASLSWLCIKLSMRVHMCTHICGINKYGSKQKSVIGGIWTREHVCFHSAPPLPFVHIHAQGAAASGSSDAASGRFRSVTRYLQRGSDTQWASCYYHWLTLLESSFSPFRYVLRVKTQIATHLRKFILLIHWIQSTWIWKIKTLIWFWVWLSSCVIIFKLLNFFEFILWYLQGWMLLAYHALLLPALVSCYALHVFTWRKFQESRVVSLLPV